VQSLGRCPAIDEGAAHVLGVDEDRVGAFRRLVGQVHVRAPRRRDDRAVGDVGRDPAPAREIVRLDDVGLEAVQDVAQPLLCRLGWVVDDDVVERERAPAGLLVARDQDRAAERPGMLGPAPRVADVQRAELQDAWAGSGDQPC